MKWVKNLPVGIKIIGGFIVALVMMLLVGVVSITRLNNINQSFANLSGNLLEDSQLANEMLRQIYRTRLFANRYALSGDGADLDLANEDLNTLAALFVTANEQITAAERVLMLEDVEVQYDIYQMGLGEIVSLTNDRQRIESDILGVEGPVILENLEAIMQDAYIEGNLDAVYQAGKARSAAALMRLNIYRFIEAGEPIWITAYDERYHEMEGYIWQLKSSVDDTLQQQALDRVIVAIEIFDTNVAELIPNYSRQANLIAENLDVSGPQMRRSASDIMESVGSESDAEAIQVAGIVSETKLIIIVVMIIAMAFGIVIGIVITRSITKPLGEVMALSTFIADVDLQNLANEISALAEGDLTRGYDVKAQPLQIDSRDEVGKMADGFNGMISSLQKTGLAFQRMLQNLRESIMQVADNAANVSVASSQLAAAAKQAGLATSQIASTTQQVASGTAQQAQSITTTASSVEQMNQAIEGVARGAQEQSTAASKAADITANISETIQQVSNNAQNVTVQTEKASDAAQLGSDTMAKTLTGMQSIREKVGQSASKVQEMGDRSQQIGVIVETIEDIASQTNLLALNAAIEAARAGEHGKGFAVVADEVRKLAERSSDATKEIGGLIKGIQDTVMEAIDAMQDGSAEVDKGVAQANEAERALKAILEAAEAVYAQASEAASGTMEVNTATAELVVAVDTVSAVIEENTASTEEMAANSEEVTQAIDNIASISEENSAAVEEVSASAEEMNAQVEEVNASAGSLAEMANLLQQVVARFKLTDHQLEQQEEAPHFEEANKMEEHTQEVFSKN